MMSFILQCSFLSLLKSFTDNTYTATATEKDWASRDTAIHQLQCLPRQPNHAHKTAQPDPRRLREAREGGGEPLCGQAY